MHNMNKLQIAQIDYMYCKGMNKRQVFQSLTS